MKYRSISARPLLIAYAYATCVSCVLIFFAVYGWAAHTRATGSLAVYFLDVGQGDAALIKTPEDYLVLIDAGRDNIILSRLASVLPSWRRRIDTVIITHADSDHYAGLFGVLEQYTVGEIYFNGSDDDDEYFQKLLQDIQRRRVPLKIMSQGDRLAWPSGVRLATLWPPRDFHVPGSNSKSIVQLLTWGDLDILFTGDIHSDEEEKLLPILSPGVEVLKVAHHGSASSSRQDFIDLIHPAYCIISAGTKNSYGHPSPKTLARLEKEGCAIKNTAAQGTIYLYARDNSLDIH